MIAGPIRVAISFIFMLFLGAVFSTIGGLIGAMMFARPLRRRSTHRLFRPQLPSARHCTRVHPPLRPAHLLAILRSTEKLDRAVVSVAAALLSGRGVGRAGAQAQAPRPATPMPPLPLTQIDDRACRWTSTTGRSR
jgi:hypothetical protein